jgi:hypothetical protein
MTPDNERYDNLARGGPPVERPAGASSYGPCGAPSCTMAWTATVRMLEVELERLREAVSWYVAERERYLRHEPTAGLDEAWEALRRAVR